MPQYAFPCASQGHRSSAKITVIHRVHEYEHVRSRLRSLGSRSPRAHRRPRRQGARGNGRARGASGGARRATVSLRRPGPRFALHLLHGRPSPVRGRRVQSHLRGPRLSALSGDPRPARLRRAVAHVRPDAASAPHARRITRRCWPAPGRSRREIEALVAELAPRPDVPTSVRKLPEPATAARSPSRRRRDTWTSLRHRRSHLRRSRRPHVVRSSRRRRRSAIASSSRSARRATTRSGASRLFSAARSRTAMRASSSSVP